MMRAAPPMKAAARPRVQRWRPPERRGQKHQKRRSPEHRHEMHQRRRPPRRRGQEFRPLRRPQKHQAVFVMYRSARAAPPEPMTALSLTRNVRRHGFQMHHCPLRARGPLRRQRKVGAAPHRGNANRPIRNQGKANAIGKRTKPPSRQRTKEKARPPAPNHRASRRQQHQRPRASRRQKKILHFILRREKPAQQAAPTT
jgi:hypothetical protein